MATQWIAPAGAATRKLAYAVAVQDPVGSAGALPAAPMPVALPSRPWAPSIEGHPWAPGAFIALGLTDSGATLGNLRARRRAFTRLVHHRHVFPLKV